MRQHAFLQILNTPCSFGPVLSIPVLHFAHEILKKMREEWTAIEKSCISWRRAPAPIKLRTGPEHNILPNEQKLDDLHLPPGTLVSWLL
jgi:hypothetical protein